MMSRQLPASLLLLTCGLAALPACGGDDGGGSGDPTATGTDPDTTAGTQGVTSSVTMDDSASMTDPDTTMDPTEDTVDTVDTVDPDTSTGEPAGDVAFRFTSLFVRDPHLFLGGTLAVLECQDGTDDPITTLIGEQESVNAQFNAAIGQDGPDNPDGSLDLSLVLVFRPLSQADGASGSVDFANGNCLVPADNTICSLLGGTELYPTMYAGMTSGVCQEPVASDLSPEGYAPSPGTTNGPCFNAGPSNVVIQTSFAALPLDNATIAAQYSGDPADGLVEGTIRGFITVANAEAIMLPSPINAAVQGGTLAGTLPGHPDCCAGHSDLDEGDTGWWFYADFTAEVVPWND
jgi:hypothetical protein